MFNINPKQESINRLPENARDALYAENRGHLGQTGSYNNDAGTDSFRWAVNELQTKPYVSEIVIRSHVGRRSGYRFLLSWDCGKNAD